MAQVTFLSYRQTKLPCYLKSGNGSQQLLKTNIDECDMADRIRIIGQEGQDLSGRDSQLPGGNQDRQNYDFWRRTIDEKLHGPQKSKDQTKDPAKDPLQNEKPQGEARKDRPADLHSDLSKSEKERAGDAMRREAQDGMRHLYVSTEGDDRGQCSAAAPCKTIGRAVDLATAGTTIDIAPGIYPEQVRVNKSGSQDAPITLKGAQGPDRTVIDLSGQTLSGDLNQYGVAAAIDLSKANHVVVDGLTVRNLNAGDESVTPAAVYAAGSMQDLTVKNMDIYNIRAQNSPDGHAHAIAIFGTGKEQTQAAANIKIESNKIHDLKLGGSEAVVVNGNVDGFSVSYNTLTRLNNIGIDIIGAEGKAPAEVDFARHGKVLGNTIDGVDSYGNPAYGKDKSAGGIYVDGGREIEIAGNTIRNANYGISIGSEHAGGIAYRNWIHNNIIADNEKAGLDIGAYDSNLGSARGNIVENNRFINNDRIGVKEGHVLFQNNAVDNIFQNNSFEKTRDCRPVADYGEGNSGNEFRSNRYDCGHD